MKRTNRSIVVLAVAALLSTLLSNVAFGDAVADTDIHIEGTEATDTYTNTLTVDIHTHPEHCPSGGDMNAVEVAFSNSSSAGPWTVVKADGDDWPTGNCVDGAKPAATSFEWTLASGADGTRTVHVRFRHGNTSVTSADAIIVDTTAPVITDAGPTAGPDGSGGWYTVAVLNQFTASDTGGSGLADPAQAAFNVSSGSNEGAAVTIPSGTVADVAGNVADSIDSGAFKIDLSNPSIAITSHADGDTVSTDSITVVGTASDAVSGLAGVTVNGLAATLGANDAFSRVIALECGPNDITATATDNAGRQSSTDTITVNRTCGSSGDWSAVRQPINANGTSTFKAGKGVIPVKFQWLDEDGNVVKDASIAPQDAELILTRTGGAGTAGPVTENLTTGSANTGWVFRYDEADGNYVYNLSAKGLSAGTYTVEIHHDDAGSSDPYEFAVS
jgi:hypothetical protein